MQLLVSHNRTTGRRFYYIDGKRVSHSDYYETVKFKDQYAFHTVVSGDIVRNYSILGESILDDGYTY